MTTSATIPCKRITTFLCTLIIALGLFTSQVNAQQLPVLPLNTLNAITVQSPGQFQLIPAEIVDCDCSNFSVCITSQVNDGCNGGNNGSATASASGGNTPYSYSWNTKPVQKTAKASNLAAGTYTVTATDGMGCSATACVIITQGNKITLSIPTCASICKGSCTTLKVNGTTCGSYTWSPSTGLSATTGSSVTACPTATTTYTVTGTENGCTGTATVVVTVNPTTTISISTPSAICLGSCATLTISGSPCASYTWSPSKGLSATTGSSVSACPTVTTTYTVTGPDHNGCPATGTVVVTVNPATTITIPPATICYGSCATLTISGSPCASYTWSPSKGLSATTGSSVSACPTVTTTYTVTGPDHNGCSATGTVVVTVNPKPTISVPSASICYGNSTTLTASGATSYTWSPAAGLSATTGSIVTANPTVTTTYTITGTNGNDCTGTTTTVVTVNPLPTISVPSATVCYGNSATLTASGATSYTWSPATGLSATTGSIVTANPTVTTTYVIYGTNGNSCVGRTTTVVTVNPLPTVSVIAKLPAVCSGNPDTLIASGATTYTWSPATGLSATTGAMVIASPTINTKYTVTGTNSNDCASTDTISVVISPAPKVAINVNPSTVCSGSPDTLVASGAMSYIWSPATGLSATSGSSVIATPTVSTTYDVVGISNIGCESLNVTVVPLTVNPKPTIAVPSASICYGNSTTLTASGATSYTWSPATGLSATTGASVTANPTVTTTYTIIGTNGSDCTDTTTTVVTVNPLPTISVPPASACIGNCATLTASGATNYTWSPATALSATTGSIVNACPEITATYSVTGTNQYDCSNTTSVVVTINPLPVITLTARIPICIGGSDTITASGATSYTWSPATGLSATTGAIVIANPTVTTKYKVIGINGNGCVCNDSITITVNPLPVINVPPAAICYGNSTVLTATGATSYTWSPANGLSATTGSTVTANPTVTTTYTITGTNGSGCTNTTTTTVTVNPLPTISVPGATVCYGNSAVLTASGAASYTWSPANGLSATTGAIVIATPSATTTYTITGTNANNCTSTTTSVVAVNPLPTISVPGATVCYGNSAALTASGATSYTWSPANGLSATTGAIVTATPSATTTYTITGTNANNCTSTTTSVVTVNPLPTISVPGATVCYGNSAVLTASGATSYTWSPANGLSATTGAIVTATPSATTTYTITGTNANNCTSTTTTVVNVNSLPQVSVPGATICYGNCAALTATGAASYTWSPANGLSATTGAIVNACPTATTTYTITGTAGTNCVSTTTAVVTVNPLPVISVPGATVCYGNSAALTASGATSYTWSPANGLSATTGAIVTATPSATTTYTITGTNANNCTSTTTAVVTVNPLPIVAVPSATICYGNSAVLTASGASTYTWSPANGLSATTGAIVTATPTATTTYTITGTSGTNCVSTTTTVVTVTPKTILTLNLKNDTVCAGVSVTFTVGAIGSNLTYTWQENGVTIGGQTSTSYTIPSVTLSDSGVYSVIVSGACGTDTSTATLKVNSKPIITIQPRTNIMCAVNGECDGHSFKVVATGVNVSYQWYFDGKLIPGATDTIYSFSPGTYADTGEYFAIVSNQCGSDTSDTATFILVNTPVISVPSASICYGNCTTLTASGTDAIYYSWSPAAGLSATTGSTVNACPTITTTYTITATGIHGCTDTTTTVVTVNPLPTISVPGATVCYGNSAALTASGATSYTWSPANGLSATTGAIVIATPSATTTYTITGTNANNCTSTTTAVVTVNPLPVVSVPGATVCYGNSAVLTASGAASYTWSPANGLSATTGAIVIATPSATTTYTITGTNANNCTSTTTSVVTVNPLPTISVPGATVCYGNSAALTASGATSYTWSPANGLSATTGAIVTATPTATTTYTITGTNANNCTSTTTSVVAVNPLPTISVPGATVCYGNSAALTASGATSYTWSPANGLSATTGAIVTATPSATTTYTITGTNANNCTSTTTSVVTVNPLPTISVPGATVCYGNSAVLTASGATSYTWSPANGLSATTGAIVTATPSATTTYTITGTNANNCTSTTTAVVTVNPLPIVAVPSATICYGNCAALTATGAASYTWSPANGLSATTGAIVNACPTATTTYTITGTAGTNCVSTTTAVVIVNLLPVVSVPGATVCYGNSAVLTASGAVSYTWSPANGLSATTGAIITATPSATTTYTITGTNANNCTSTTTSVVTVNPLPTVSVIAKLPAVCSGNPDTLIASGATTYTWSPAAGLSATTGAMVIASPTINTKYTVTGTNGNNCVSTDTISVVISPAPVVKIFVNPSEVCAGNPDTLLASGATTYIWSPSAGLSATSGSEVIATPTASTTYDVVGISNVGCESLNITVVPLTVNPKPTISVPGATVCYGNCAALTASGALSYTWSPANGLSATTGAIVNSCPVATTTYTIIGTNSTGCTDTVTAIVIVNPLPIVAVPSATICYGNSAVLTASGASTYTWSPANGLSATTGAIVTATPTATTTYTITGTSGTNCVSTTTTVVTVTPKTILTLNLKNDTVCAGVSVTFTVGAIGSNLTYTWQENGVTIGGQTSTSYTIPSVTLSDSGVYSVIVSGACGTDTSTATLKVNSKPIITIQPRTNIMCAVNGECDGHSFKVVATGVNVSYQWYFDGKLIPGATDTIYSFSPGTYADTGEYFAIVSNQCGSDTSDTATFILVNTPVISVPSASICYGNCTTLTASGTDAIYYSWSPAAGLSATTGSTVNACPTITTTYTITATGIHGCTDTTTTVVTVNTPPTISAPPATICYGSCATLQASGLEENGTYTWSVAGGESTTSGAIVQVCPTATTTYTIIGTNGSGCSDTITTTVTVNPKPTINVPPATICYGSCATLQASGLDENGTYSWSSSAGEITSRGATIQVCPTVTTTYTVIGTNVYGCSDTITTTVTVNPLPSISVPPATVCYGNSAVLTASGATLYTWKPSTGLNTTTGAIVTATPSATTTYTVIGTNGNDCVDSTTTIVTVNPLPVVSVPGATVCYGNSATLTASGATSYTWSPANGLSATTGAIVTATPSATTTYTITGTNANNCTSTTTAVVIVNPLPVVSVPGATVCYGNSAVLTASGATSYTWSPATSLSATTGAIVTANPTTTTTYTVIGTNESGCSDTTITTVNVNTLPIITVPPATVCYGNSAALTASGATSYTWSPANGLSATTGAIVTANPTVTTTYTVAGTSGSNCSGITIVVVTVNPLPTISVPPATICYGNSAALTATGATSYIWTPATGLSATTGSIVTANPTVTTTYTVDGTDGNSCVGTTTVVVTVNPLPTVSVPPATVCYGNSAVLTASGATSYTWSPSASLGATTGAIVTADPTVTTTYTVVGTNENGCTDTTTTTVNVNTLPTITVPPATVCYGNSAVLTASGATSYTWSPANGLSATTGSIVTANPTVTTTYTVDGSNGNNCSGTTTVVVTVDTLPTIQLTESSPSICIGGIDTLRATGANGYTWNPAVYALEGLPYVTVDPTVTTTYTVTGTNNNGCEDSAKIVVVVNPLPIISVPPASVCIGNCATLTASGATSYTWSPAIALSATTGSIVNACPQVTTTYTVTGTNASGCVGTTTVVVTVNPLPVITLTAKTPSICIGSSDTITASGATIYTWSPATGLNVTTGAVVIATPTVTTTYKVIGTNGNGCVCNDSITIIVNPLPVINVPLATVCYGNSAVLTASGAASYTWNPATGLSATTGSIVTANPTATTTYTVVGTNESGCADTTTTTVTVNPLPTVSVPPATVCYGNSAVLTASGATSYTWSPSGSLSATTGAIVTADPTVTTTYTVVGTNENGCTDTTTTTVNVNTLPTITVPPATVCYGNSAVLTASGATSYTWSPATGLSATTGAIVTANPTVTTTYTVDGSNGNNCSGTTTVVVTVDTLPSISVSESSPSICTGSTDTLRATGANGYTWTPQVNVMEGLPYVTVNPTTTTTYTVTGTNNNGCEDSAKIVVIVNPLPTVTVPPATVCYGNSTVLTASGAPSYTWSPATGLSATTGSIVTANPPATTTYTVVGTNESGCTDTTTTIVTVNPKPTITVATPAPICNGNAILLIASGAGEDGNYTWSPALGLNSTTGSSVTANPTVTTTYTVIGAYATGCPDTTTVIVTVLPTTTIITQLNNDTVCAGTSATFTVSASGNDLTYIWQKNDTTINGQNSNTYTIPSATIADSGVYSVIVNGTCGIDTSTAVLKVNSAPGNIGLVVNDSTINNGQNYNLSLCASAGQPLFITINVNGTDLTFQWQKNGVNVSGAATDTFTIQNVTISDTGSYRVIATGPCGADTSALVDLLINNNPIVVSVTVNDAVVSSKVDTISECAGNAASFSVSATGSGLTYQWQKNGVNINGAISSTYTIASTIPSDAGLYDVIVTGTCGADTSYAPLKINTKPYIKTQPQGVTECVTYGRCNAVTFCATATGVNLSYQWQFNGTNINGATSACYTINYPTLADTGRYRVIVSNQCGADTGNAARLILYGAPVIISQPVCLTVCSGNSATFCVTASGSNLTYQWQFNGKNINGANSSCYTISSSALRNAGCYDVVVSNSCNSTTSSVATLTINTPPVITCQPKGESLCSMNGRCGGNDGVTFCVTATGSNLSYEWLYNGNKIHGANSSCYTINPVTTSNAGNYDVIVSNSCGSDTSNVATLTIGSSPVITSQPACIATCSGSTATFCVTATGSNLTYQWQFNGKNIKGANSSCYTIQSAASCNAGCYDVVVSNSCGSITSSTATLTISTPPAITCQPQGQSLCSVSGKCGGSDGVTFCVTATGSNLSYQWQYNGNNIHRANSSCYTINPVTASNAGCYSVIVSNSCGSVTSNTATLTIGSSPVITSQPVCASVCSGNGATFCVTATGTNLTYRWQFNGKNINGATSCCYTISSAASCNAGCYDVVVSNSCGSVTSSTATLTVNGAPCITSQPVCETACAGSGATFSVTASGSNLSYQWQFNGKNINRANSSCYTIASTTSSNAGCYDVIVSNSCSCVTSNIATLTVTNCSTCDVPTDLRSSDITCTGATLSWSYQSSASSFTVEYKAIGCSIWSTETVRTNSLTLTCLSSGKSYEWSVSENCSCGSSSGYASTVEFCTSNNCCNGNAMAPRGGNGSDDSSSGNTITDVKVYPNPTFSLTTLEAKFEKESDVTVMVTDLTGRVIMSETETAPAGDYIHQFDMSKQQAGAYFLIIRSADQMITSKIVKIE